MVCFNYFGRQTTHCHTPAGGLSPDQAAGFVCGSAWITFSFDIARSGVNPEETLITTKTVASLHRLWVRPLPQVVDSAPILLPDVILPDGTQHNILYMTTKAGSLLAVDAGTGALLWATRPTQHDPNKMTTSSPVVNPDHTYIYSYGLDGMLHRYLATSGQEVRGGGWPLLVTTMKDSEKESSALNAADDDIYITTSSFGGDAPPYQGHLIVVNLAQGTTHIFNALCSRIRHILAPDECHDNGAGIWARVGVVIDPITGHLFLATGNGPYTASQGGDDWGDSVLEFTQDGARLLDSYTPDNPADLFTQDQDLGSAAPALLPVIANSRTPFLAVQAGKEGVLRLLNRQNLSGQGGPGHIGGELQTLDAPDHCPVLTQPAVWTDPLDGDIWVFVSNNCAISGYQVLTSSQGITRLRKAWSVGASATSPIIAGDVLFAATSINGIVALDPHNGRQLWSSSFPTARGNTGSIHWESPIVIGGRLYCTDENGQLNAYGL